MLRIAILALALVIAFRFLLDCESLHDDALVRFEPGVGYEEIPLADERSPSHSTSYLRRDLMHAVQAAAAAVGPGRPVELGDMSERDGSTPGHWAGRPRHPSGTHVGGRDVDVAYFQIGVANHIHPICEHVAEGVDQHHCLAPPLHLDIDRTARFIAALFASHHIRAIGVDGLVGPTLEAALARLGHPELRLSFETRDDGRGWFYDHHTHMHVSWSPSER